MEDAVTLLAPLARNLDILRSRLGAPRNADVLIRRFQSGAFESAIVAIDGMVSSQLIDENILKPCMDLPCGAGEEIAPQERAAYLMKSAVSILPMKMKENIDEILADVLGGQCALLCEGCGIACVMDTRGFEKRTIGKPEVEHVVLGPHESFSESIRTNITLVRRIVQREELTTEFISAGGKMKTRCALLYLRGTADEKMIEAIRARIEGCTYDFPLTSGEVEQLIEQHPLSLLPQVVRTERPDRAASFLVEGQIVVLTDGSPAALGAPATIFHQLHTPDDASMRWQYGTFMRLIRMLGMLIHVFLPGLYLAVLRFHPQLLSPMLLTSVYESSSRVPVPLFLEALLMTLAFDLINEAGLRAPGAMGGAVSIVSGLILGQSAVSADIVSPLLLIIVAASGLGGFCIPGYAMSIGLKIVQLMFLTAGAMGGLYAMSLLLVCLLCALCGMESISSPLTAPLAPPRRANPDILLRLPMRFQKARAFFAKRRSESSGRA
ncbi:MAG: spore germination protein [Clostridia bacterium]|nr:spore germination protein [Clostridia bacterium]